MKTIAAFLLLLAGPSLLLAEPNQPVSIKEGFITGNDFRGLAYDAKRGYAIGVVEGIFLAPFFDASKNELLWIERCTINMTDAQVVAILEKFLRDNPARWHEPMNILAWVAMKEGCGK